MTDLKSVGIHGTELAGYSSVVGQPIMLKNEAGNYIGQLALIGFQGKYKEAVSAIAEALDAPSRHAYKVGFAAGRADAMREAAQPSPAEAAKVLTAEDRENIVDEIESIICETHDMDVRDVDYAENIVSWLERHHPAALRAMADKKYGFHPNHGRDTLSADTQD